MISVFGTNMYCVLERCRRRAYMHGIFPRSVRGGTQRRLVDLELCREDFAAAERNVQPLRGKTMAWCMGQGLVRADEQKTCRKSTFAVLGKWTKTVSQPNYASGYPMWEHDNIHTYVYFCMYTYIVISADGSVISTQHAINHNSKHFYIDFAHAGTHSI